MKPSVETITITVKKSTLELLLAAGNYSHGDRTLSEAMARNAIDHAAWLANLICDADQLNERGSDPGLDFYWPTQLAAVQELIRAVENAESELDDAESEAAQ